jgi:hypothetical protein
MELQYIFVHQWPSSLMILQMRNWLHVVRRERQMEIEKSSFRQRKEDDAKCCDLILLVNVPLVRVDAKLLVRTRRLRF